MDFVFLQEIIFGAFTFAFTWLVVANPRRQMIGVRRDLAIRGFTISGIVFWMLAISHYLRVTGHIMPGRIVMLASLPITAVGAPTLILGVMDAPLRAMPETTRRFINITSLLLLLFYCIFSISIGIWRFTHSRIAFILGLSAIIAVLVLFIVICIPLLVWMQRLRRRGEYR